MMSVLKWRDKRIKEMKQNKMKSKILFICSKGVSTT